MTHLICPVQEPWRWLRLAWRWWPAAREEVDAHGQVQRTYGGMQFHGSASIVKRNGRYVLVSAGHVIDGEGMDTHCGDIGISYQEGTSHSVDKAEKVSANYGPTALPGYGPDIGVIEPTQPADAAFPMPLSTTPPLAGDVGFVMGYHDPFPGEAERDPSPQGHVLAEYRQSLG
jgi:hypothetical protein